MAQKRRPKSAAKAKPGRTKPPKSARGAPIDPERLASASKESVAAYKARVEEGRRASGAFPAVRDDALPRAATDDAIGDTAWALTEDARLLQHGGPRPDFRSTDTWRVMRIMSEFIEGFDKLAKVEKGVSIFGSARTHPDDPQYIAAVETARLLGERGFSIITGAGPGIMEAANKGARLAHAPSIGCNIELPFEQGTNPYVDTNVAFRYFAVRKTMFIKYSSAFIIFPGGFGTFDELFEALTLIQTGKISQFPVVLFGTHYWAGLVRWLNSRVLAERKISAGDMDLMVVTDDPAEAARVVEQAYELQLKTARQRANQGRRMEDRA